MQPDSPSPTVAATIPSRKADDIQGAVQSADFFFYSVLLAAVLLIAAGAFYFLDRWRKSGVTGETERETSMTLSAFRESYENGEMTEAEYQRIRDRLASRMKSSSPGVPPPVQKTEPTRTPETDSEPTQKPRNPLN